MVAKRSAVLLNVNSVCIKLFLCRTAWRKSKENKVFSEAFAIGRYYHVASIITQMSNRFCRKWN